MKRMRTIFGIVAVAAVIGFGFTSCDTGTRADAAPGGGLSPFQVLVNYLNEAWGLYDATEVRDGGTFTPGYYNAYQDDLDSLADVMSVALERALELELTGLNAYLIAYFAPPVDLNSDYPDGSYPGVTEPGDPPTVAELNYELRNEIDAFRAARLLFGTVTISDEDGLTATVTNTLPGTITLVATTVPASTPVEWIVYPAMDGVGVTGGVVTIAAGTATGTATIVATITLTGVAISDNVTVSWTLDTVGNDYCDYCGYDPCVGTYPDCENYTPTNGNG